MSPCRASSRAAFTSAAVVAAHDDVLDREHLDRVLQDGEAVEVGVHDDVGDVAVHEDLAGARPTISFAGTRLSEQPIQRYSGAWRSASPAKKPGSSATIAAALSVALEELAESRHAARLALGDVGVDDDAAPEPRHLDELQMGRLDPSIRRWPPPASTGKIQRWSSSSSPCCRSVRSSSPVPNLRRLSCADLSFPTSSATSPGMTVAFHVASSRVRDATYFGIELIRSV